MGRNLPPFAPAGRKRRGPSFPALSPCKLRRTAEATSGWASLPADLIHLVASRLILTGSGDVVDYITFRAVCSGWRSSTPPPRDPTLRRSDLRPRGWVALCDGDAVRPDAACEITFFHTRTARRLRVPLREQLRSHRIVGFSEGLVILLHKRTAAVRVLNPFTRDAVGLPSLVPAVHEVISSRYSRDTVLGMNAAVCDSASSPASIAVVVWFPYTGVVLAAEPGFPKWEVLHEHVPSMSVLPYQGRLYATMFYSTEIMQLYPRSACPVLAHVPDGFGEPMHCKFYLVESRGQMLLAVYHIAVDADLDSLQRVAYTVYAVDVDGGGALLSPVSSLGDRALFLSKHRCLSVSARDLPSVAADSIYFSFLYHNDPVVVHSLRTGLTEQPLTACQIHDGKDRIRPSVHPFTIADHLLTFCHPLEWTKGLMFHEYHRIPESFQELKNNIKAKDSQVRIPRDAHGVFLAMGKRAGSPRFALPTE